MVIGMLKSYRFVSREEKVGDKKSPENLPYKSQCGVPINRVSNFNFVQSNQLSVPSAIRAEIVDNFVQFQP